MRPKFLLNVAAFLLCSSFYAQRVDVYVHFPKGSAQPENESLIALKKWASANVDCSQELLLLRGHTDMDAGDQFNLKLSERRNKSVRKLLALYGFHRVQFSSHGESWPLCSTSDEECLRENRRVEVLLLDESFEIFGQNLQKTSPQVIFVEPSQINEIQGREGTLISIPECAFAISTGMEEKKVRIEFREFLTLKDCLLNGLTTTCDGQLLGTGGMIYLQAFVGDQEVQLAEGKLIDVLFSSQIRKPDPQMQAFSGEVSAKRINWKPSSGRQITLPNEKGKSELKYSQRYLKKDGTYQRDLFIGGREVTVTYGRETETIASFSSEYGPVQPLTVKERQMILDEINCRGFNSAAPLSFSQTGWYNCDRFIYNQSAIAQIIMPKVDPKTITSMELLNYYLIFDDLSVVVGGVINDQGQIVFNYIPSGRKATLLVYGAGLESSVFSMKDILTSKEMETVELHTISNKDIQSKLERFSVNI